MQNDKEKFKTDLKGRIYYWVIRMIKFLDSLPKGTVSRRLVDQLFRSGGSGIGANYVKARASSSKIELSNILGSSILTLKGRK